jgi:hypothetical protein
MGEIPTAKNLLIKKNRSPDNFGKSEMIKYSIGTSRQCHVGFVTSRVKACFTLHVSGLTFGRPFVSGWMALVRTLVS